MEFFKDMLHGKIRAIGVNNVIPRGLRLLNERRTVSLTSGLGLLFENIHILLLWIETKKDSVGKLTVGGHFPSRSASSTRFDQPLESL